MSAAGPAAGTAMRLPPPVLRSVYRRLLRACDSGRRPEVFAFDHLPLLSEALPPPPPSTTATAAQLGSGRLPKAAAGFIELGSPRDVVRAVRRAFHGEFRDPTSGRNVAAELVGAPFAALRDASVRRRALCPDAASDVPPGLPAFVYPHTLLPGERARFHFFEPRYKRLCELALDLAPEKDKAAAKGKSANEGAKRPLDGRYVHLHGVTRIGDVALDKPVAAAEGEEEKRFAAGTLVTITDHQRLPDGRFFIECIAGPRIAVTRERTEPVDTAMPGDDSDGETPVADPLRRVDVTLLRDVPPVLPDHAAQVAVLAAEVRTLLADLAAATGGFGECTVPPVYDPEALSFYALQLALPSGVAAAARVHWLLSRSTLDRLTFARGLLAEAVASVHAAKASRGGPRSAQKKGTGVGGAAP